MKTIDKELLDQTSRLAVQSERKRKNHNFHPTLDDTLQRLLNAVEPGSYIRPHKHEDPDKREVFIILRGRFVVVEFDADGAIAGHVILDPEAGCHGVELGERTWHTIISLAPGSVVYEVKDGPYSPITDKNFASWAPPEGDPEAPAYIDGILRKLGIEL
jgi:cupin fold WbuC family metalloprotein